MAAVTTNTDTRPAKRGSIDVLEYSVLSPTFSSEGVPARALAWTGVLLCSVVWIVVVVVDEVVVVVVVVVVGADMSLVVTVEDLLLLRVVVANRLVVI